MLKIIDVMLIFTSYILYLFTSLWNDLWNIPLSISSQIQNIVGR